MQRGDAPKLVVASQNGASDAGGKICVCTDGHNNCALHSSIRPARSNDACLGLGCHDVVNVDIYVTGCAALTDGVVALSVIKPLK